MLFTNFGSEWLSPSNQILPQRDENISPMKKFKKKFASAFEGLLQNNDPYIVLANASFIVYVKLYSNLNKN